MKKLLFLVLVCHSLEFSQTKTWTGATNTVWTEGSNWTPAGIPTTADDIIIPATPANQPTLSATTGVAKSVEVESGATLTIANSGKLTINDSKSYNSPIGSTVAINNAGTVENNGQILLGNTGSIGNVGVYNQGIFNTNAGSILQIDNASSNFIQNKSGTFTNVGSIEIGLNLSTGAWGIYNESNFNNTGGELKIKTGTNIWNTAPFTNAAKITLTGSGIYNTSTFTNTTTGEITVDDAPTTIDNQSSGDFDNAGKIYLGQNTGVGRGIYNYGTFDNLTGAEIEINNITSFDMGVGNYTGTFTNSGKLVIGEMGVIPIYGLQNNAIFLNNVSGIIEIDNVSDQALRNYRTTFTNNGTISIGTKSPVGTGIYNTGSPSNPAVFDNSSTGIITVNDVSFAGIFNNDNSTFTNDNTISVTGANGVFNSYGIRNQHIFTNNPNGVISANNCAIAGVANEKTFTNHNRINIGQAINGGALGAGILNAFGSFSSSPSFDNKTTGEIVIDRSGTGIYSAQSFVNEGKITIGGVATVDGYGIQNEATFDNKVSGEITIGRTTFDGIRNGRQDTFINSGKITVGLNGSTGEYVIYNDGAFTNNAGGDIKLDNATKAGILNDDFAGVFNNAGKLTIGANGSVGANGIENKKEFNNNAGGEVYLNNSTTNGILNSSTSTITNSSILTLGATASVGQKGIYNSGGTFTNTASASLSIDNATAYGFDNFSGTFSNAGQVSIGGSSAVGADGFRAYNNFTNQACGVIEVHQGKFSVFTGSSVNNGYLYVANNFTNGTGGSSVFTNDGVLKYGSLTGLAAINATNSSIVVNNTPTPIFTYGGTYDGTVDGIFTDAAATISAGTFTAPNTFAKGALPAGLQTLYAKITTAGSACTHIVPFTYDNAVSDNAELSDLTTPAGALTPTFTSSQTNYAVTVNNTVSTTTITATVAEPNATMVYSLDGGDTTFPLSSGVASSSIPLIVGNNAVQVTVTAEDLTTTITYEVIITRSGIPEINLIGNGQAIADGSTTVSVADDTDFGSLSFSSGADTHTFTIENTGNDQLILSSQPSINNTTDFTISTIAGGTLSIAPATSRTFTVTFDPVTAGIKSATVTIESNDVDEGTYTFVVEGQGTCGVAATATELLTWTGTVSTDWDDPCNWSPNGIPTATNDVEIPSGATSQPTISSVNAVAKSIQVFSGATLDIASTGVLTINDSRAAPTSFVTAFYNAGTIENNGNITLGNSSNIGDYGLLNYGNFNNISGAEVEIDNATGTGLYHVSGTFTNAAKISIGKNASSGFLGIENNAVFNNGSGAEISVDRTGAFATLLAADTFGNSGKINIGSITTFSGSGLYMNAGATLNNLASSEIRIDRNTGSAVQNFGTVSNTGKIMIGQNAQSGGVGVFNANIFNNNTGAEVSIDNVSNTGLYNEDVATFTNAAKIYIGSNAAVGFTGLDNKGIFNNNAGGDISVNNGSIFGLRSRSGTFTNAAKIQIGSMAPAAQVALSINTGTFNNTTGAELLIDNATGRGIQNDPSGIFTNDAQVKLGQNALTGSRGITNFGSFTNFSNGTLLVDNCTFYGIGNEATGTITNTGKITLGALGTGGDNGLLNSGIINNEVCGEFLVAKGDLRVSPSGTFTNKGYSLAIIRLSNANIFTNEGVLKYTNSSGNSIANPPIHRLLSMITPSQFSPMEVRMTAP